MSNYILKEFSKSIDIGITPERLKRFRTYLIEWELRKGNIDSLNSHLLGTEKTIYSRDDRETFFEIFDTTESYVKKVIEGIPSINKEFNVTSDAFNLFAIWVAHRILNTKMRDNVKYAGMVINLLQYKFFSSLVNRYFLYGADKDIMVAVYESLTLKFSIRRLGSWKKVIMDKTESVLSKSSIHYKTLYKFSPDNDVLYILSDIQTKLRGQIKRIAALYYEFNDMGNVVTSTSSTTELDNKKLLKDASSGFVSLGGYVFFTMTNKAMFENEQYINALVKTVGGCSEGLLRKTIHMISDEAIQQREDKTSTKMIKHRDGSRGLIGWELIVKDIIYTTFIKFTKTKHLNKLAVFSHAHKLFSVYRKNDTLVNDIKMSIMEKLVKYRVATRERTLKSLTTMVCLYIVLVALHTLENK